AETAPEELRLCIERSAARQEGPKLQSECSVNAAELPPPDGCVPLVGFAELAMKHVERAARLIVAFDLVAQRLEDTRHGYDHRDALPLDRLDDVRWAEGIVEDHFAANELRHEDPHELPED